ncbi:MAG: HEAT repeat domain-containing protein, partial [Armatimonadetes bacterium]|nr:HEAT repeat domain-containing protein [Armatimonadota bacterium]
RHYLGGWISALPRPLLNRLLFKQAARPQPDFAGMSGPFCLELGEEGMRRWAERFSADLPFPDNDDASRIWRASSDARAMSYELKRWDLFGSMHPNSYEIELHERSEDYLPDLCWELLDAPDPRQRYWACSHLLRLIPRTWSDSPSDERLRLLRAMLTDDHFMVTSLLFRDGGLDLDDQSNLLQDELRQCLHHEAEPVRVMAAAELIEMGDAAGVAFAARALPEACEATADALLYAFSWGSDATSDEQKMTLLAPMISWMRRHKVGGRIVNALGEIPPQAVPAITEMLDDPELEVRRDTAWILGEIGDPSAVPTLEKLLDHPDGRMRINALGALGKILQADVAPYLDDFLRSDDPDDREAAFWAAYNAEDVKLMAQVVRRAPETCIDMGIHGYDGITDVWWPPARKFMGYSEAPGMDGREPARAELDPILAACHEVLADADASRRGRFNAAWFVLWHNAELTSAVEADDGPRRDPPLPDELLPCVRTVLESPDLWPDWVAFKVEEQIGRVRSPEMVPALREAMLASPGPRDAFVEALAHIEPEGVELLLDDLRSEDDAVVRRAVEALLKAGVQAALEPIMDLYHSGRLRLPLHWLQQMDEAKTKPAVLAAIAADPSQVTSGDLRTLRWADEERGLALAREVLGLRTAHTVRGTAISMLAHTDSPEDLPLLRRVVHDELELYWLRYRALRGIERHRPEEAREIARRWTRDPRYDIRHLGRQILRGEEKYYL